MSPDLFDQLRALVGTTGPLQSARHPVTATAIADWCDAMGEGNPCYTDEDYAAKSRHGGLVAPPATLDIWERPGLPTYLGPLGARRRPADPRSVALRLLEEAGFVAVAAVNSELEIVRYPRPGDVLQSRLVLEDVSEEKQTALGRGHFITSRQRFETVDGEHLGDLLFRILKFKPGTGRTAAPTGDRAVSAVDPSPALRPRPSINRDNKTLFDGYLAHELRFPRCKGCDRVFFPPSPRCGKCGGFDMGAVAVPGTATLYSHVVVHHPQVPGFRYPLVVGLVDADVGDGRTVRMVADLVGVAPEQVDIGMPLEVEWLDADGLSLPQFRPATPERRVETWTAAGISAQTPLPTWVLAVTATHIVAGALATRDFLDVHHDRAAAVRKGSQDIFLNINTSLGYMQRYVSDWMGPEAVVTALRVRLGAPAYAGSLLTFSGSVQSVDRDTGRVVVGVQATNDLGPHISGTVELELPQ